MVRLPAVVRFVGILMFLLFPLSALLHAPISAQEATPEPTAEVTLEATNEVTPEATAALPPNALLDFPGPGDYTVQLGIDGIPRTLSVYIPEAYVTSSAAVPLVVVMHGAGGSGNEIQSWSGWSELAEAENFVVIYPDGLNNVWNDGRLGDARITDVNDAGFINASINFMSDKLNIDQQRIYATGFSMGGMLSFRLACQMPDRLAAIASVASSMPEYVAPYCADGEHMPVLIIQGTADNVVPFYGMPRQGLGYMSAANSLLYWTRQNECATSSGIDMLEDVDPDDGARVLLQTATDCANGADVMFYGVYYGGHNYPGHALGLDLGTTTFDIDATQVIWEFFKAHPRAAE